MRCTDLGYDECIKFHQVDEPFTAIMQLCTWIEENPVTDYPTMEPTVPTEVPTWSPTKYWLEEWADMYNIHAIDAEGNWATIDPSFIEAMRESSQSIYYDCRTEDPTEQPTEEPTQQPSERPTEQPTEDPTQQPTHHCGVT